MLPLVKKKQRNIKKNTIFVIFAFINFEPKHEGKSVLSINYETFLLY